MEPPAPQAAPVTFPFEKLPYELIFSIIRRLDARKLCRIFTVSKFFASFAEDEELWKRLCVANGALPSRDVDLRDVWALNSYRSLYIRVFRFPFCMSGYKMDQLPRSSLSKSRTIFLANCFRTKVVIEQHAQQLRLQVRAEVFVVRQLKHPNIVQLLCTSDASVLGQITDPPTSPKSVNAPPLSIMTEYMPYSLKAVERTGPGVTHNASTVLKFAKGLAAGFMYLLQNSGLIPQDFLLFTGRSILLDEHVNVKILVRDVTSRGSMSIDFIPPEMRFPGKPPEPNSMLAYLFALFVCLFATPSRTPFLRPTPANLESFVSKSFPEELSELLRLSLATEPTQRPSLSQIVATVDRLQSLIVPSEIRLRVPEPRQRSLSDSAPDARNIRKSAESGPGRKQPKPGKQGPGAVVLEIAEANFDEVKAFKQLGEGLHYTVYYGLYNSVPVTLRVLKNVDADAAERRFSAHVERWLRVKPHKGFVRFMASCKVPPIIVTQFGQWTLTQFLASTEAKEPAPRLVILQDIADALRYLHDSTARPFRHLCPAKVVIDERHHALLCDAPADTIEVSSPVRWASAVYQAPEAIGGLVAPAYQFAYAATPAQDETPCDVYAFGLLMWRVLARADPVEIVCPRTQTDTQILTSILFEHRRPPLSRLDTPLLAPLVASCWSADPAARPLFKAIYFRLSAAIPMERVAEAVAK